MKLTTGVDANISGQIVGKAVASCLTQEQIIVLAMKQYASPFMATFKELLSNALDAHHVAEVYSTPVDISVDEDVTTNTITFRFRDYGSGMSKEFLENYYFALGESTKRDDPRQTGSFGLGAKAGLIISPAMKVTTYDGEYSHTVIGQLVDGKQILCSELVSEPCAELRGFSIAHVHDREILGSVGRDTGDPRLRCSRRHQEGQVFGARDGVSSHPEWRELHFVRRVRRLGLQDEGLSHGEQASFDSHHRRQLGTAGRRAHDSSSLQARPLRRCASKGRTEGDIDARRHPMQSSAIGIAASERRAAASGSSSPD